MHLFEVVGLLFVRSSDDTDPAPQLSAQIFVPFLNLIFTLTSPAHADEWGHLSKVEYLPGHAIMSLHWRCDLITFCQCSYGPQGCH